MLLFFSGVHLLFYTNARSRTAHPSKAPRRVIASECDQPKINERVRATPGSSELLGRGTAAIAIPFPSGPVIKENRPCFRPSAVFSCCRLARSTLVRVQLPHDFFEGFFLCYCEDVSGIVCWCHLVPGYSTVQ
ncbi:hypothetical protein F4859DRAFT_459099 [Xylaria cf. heliscus]|nr:hypothetical protein F4859DRAFT_459099 [Xylaria cf. heliscus]